MHAKTLALLCRQCEHRRDTYSRGLFAVVDECTHPRAIGGLPRGELELATGRVTCRYKSLDSDREAPPC